MCKDNVIEFNPSDWESIKDTIEKINEVACIQFGTTEQGEDITFNTAKDEDGKDMLITDTYQSNGWIRRNIYHMADFTVEELYRKES